MTNVTHVTLPKWLRDTQEWVVKVRVNGMYTPTRYYFTDDYQDALATRKAMRQEVLDANGIVDPMPNQCSK